MINLKEHAVYIDTIKTDMVPLSVALEAVKEAYEINNRLEEAEKSINNAMSEINNIFKDLD
tara:strand:+ start:957 stop:1139 length:183 start_codon:yes stop_codon:yes gene_type:complete